MAIFIEYGVASTSHVDPQCTLKKIDADDFGWIFKRIRHFDHLVASGVWLAGEHGRVLIQMPRQMAPPPRVDYA
jgi:hypothetical protein